LVAADLRLVLLAAMASTWIFSLISRNWPSPALASGFVLCVWGIMLLGWLNSRFNPGTTPSEPEVPVVAREDLGCRLRAEEGQLVVKDWPPLWR